jgi:hypothetical protein
MPTRKQRRRRLKERRHEYEYVYVDSEGREVEVDEEAAQPRSQKKETPKAIPARGGRGRAVEPPSWRRSLRRGAIFAPFMVIVLYLLKPKGSGAEGVVVQALILIAFFVPFSYFMDSFVYRMAQRRANRPRGPAEKSGSGR